MINIDISNLNSVLVKDVKCTVDKVNDTNKNSNFKNIIDKVNKFDSKLDKQNTISDKCEVNTKNEEDLSIKNTKVVEKIKDIIEKIDSDESDPSEEILQLLSLLNINFVDNSSDIKINAINAENTLAILSANIENSITVGNGQNIDNQLEDFINLISQNTDINVESEEVLQKFINEIENVLPAIKMENGEEITKDTIIFEIKNILANNQDKEKVDVIQTVNEKVIVKESFIDAELDSEADLSYNQEKATEINDDESILTKLLGNTESDFSKALNNIQVRGKITNGVVSEPVTVYRSNMENDIIKNVKFMIRNSVQELKVKIYPKELGEMTIKILSEEGIMRAEIKATSKETYNLLNSNINEIKKAISNENIRIQDVEIGLYNEDTTYFNGDNSRENRENKHTMPTTRNTEKVEDIEFEESPVEEGDFDCLV